MPFRSKGQLSNIRGMDSKPEMEEQRSLRAPSPHPQNSNTRPFSLNKSPQSNKLPKQMHQKPGARHTHTHRYTQASKQASTH